MIYMLMADGFEDIEALEPLDILRRCDLEIKTAGIDKSEAISSHGVKVETDILIDDVKKEDMELLFLPGGPGHTNLDESEKVQELIDYAAANGIYIASICAAPSIIGKKGLLNGKKYTCFPGFEKYIQGGKKKGAKVVCDGKFITARGAGAAGDLGFCIAEIFVGKKSAKLLRKTMQY